MAWTARFTGTDAPQAQADRINVLLSDTAVVIELPQPCVVNLRGAEFEKPREGFQGALILVRLKQPVLNARVDAAGDDALDLQALACKEVLIVTVATVRSDATCVPQKGDSKGRAEAKTAAGDLQE